MAREIQFHRNIPSFRLIQVVRIYQFSSASLLFADSRHDESTHLSIRRLLSILCYPGPHSGPLFAPSTAYRLAGRHSTAVLCQGYFAWFLEEKRGRK